MPDLSTPTFASPYKTTPAVDEHSLPAGLRRDHKTKAGTWSIIRVPSGKVRYMVLDPASETMLDPDRPGRVRPAQLHFVTAVSGMGDGLTVHH